MLNRSSPKWIGLPQETGMAAKLDGKIALVTGGNSGIGLVSPNASHAKARLCSSLDDARMSWKEPRN